MKYAAFLALFVAVTVIAQSSITIFNYNKNNQTHDLNYYWSFFVLIIGVLAAILAMMAMFSKAQAAVTQATAAVAPPTVTVASLQGQANALQNLQKAQVEATKAFKTA